MTISGFFSYVCLSTCVLFQAVIILTHPCMCRVACIVRSSSQPVHLHDSSHVFCVHRTQCVLFLRTTDPFLPVPTLMAQITPPLGRTTVASCLLHSFHTLTACQHLPKEPLPQIQLQSREMPQVYQRMEQVYSPRGRNMRAKNPKCDSQPHLSISQVTAHSPCCHWAQII